MSKVWRVEYTAAHPERLDNEMMERVISSAELIDPEWSVFGLPGKAQFAVVGYQKRERLSAELGLRIEGYLAAFGARVIGMVAEYIDDPEDDAPAES